MDWAALDRTIDALSRRGFRPRIHVDCQTPGRRSCSSRDDERTKVIPEQNPVDRSTKVPVVVLNGFLGSGKTTLLRTLLVQARRKSLALGVIVNDMSELDVDGIIVVKTDFFEKGDPHFESIHGCVLSSRKGIEELRNATRRMLAKSAPDLLIVETSGSCHPMPLIEFFGAQPEFRLTGVLTLIDSAMIDQDYDGGRELFPAMQRNVQNGRRDTTNLLVEQVMFSSHLLLTKVDRIEESKLPTIARSIHELNPYVAVLSVPFGNLPLDDVQAMPDYDHYRVAKLIQELKPSFEQDRQDERPYHLATRVLQDDRPFHPQRLWDTCQQHLGQLIYRSKGFLYLASRDKLSLLWNQAAGGIALELSGYWRAGILEDENNGLDEEEIQGLNDWLAKEPGRFGDRRCHLTVIGDRTQVDRFTELLTECFLTEEEIAHWRSGGEFPDPWPDSFVTREY